jgi:thioredoxin 1
VVRELSYEAFRSFCRASIGPSSAFSKVIRAMPRTRTAILCFSVASSVAFVLPTAPVPQSLHAPAISMMTTALDMGPGWSPQKHQEHEQAQHELRVINDADFESAVLHADEPVVIDFFADFCGPCKLCEPALMRLDSSGEANVVKARLDKSPKLREWLLTHGIKIACLPTLVLVRDSLPVRSMIGAHIPYHTPVPLLRSLLSLATSGKCCLTFFAHLLLNDAHPPRARAGADKIMNTAQLRSFAQGEPPVQRYRGEDLPDERNGSGGLGVLIDRVSAFLNPNAW